MLNFEERLKLAHNKNDVLLLISNIKCKLDLLANERIEEIQNKCTHNFSHWTTSWGGVRRRMCLKCQKEERE